MLSEHALTIERIFVMITQSFNSYPLERMPGAARDVRFWINSFGNLCKANPQSTRAMKYIVRNAPIEFLWRICHIASMWKRYEWRVFNPPTLTRKEKAIVRELAKYDIAFGSLRIFLTTKRGLALLTKLITLYKKFPHFDDETTEIPSSDDDDDE